MKGKVKIILVVSLIVLILGGCSSFLSKQGGSGELTLSISDFPLNNVQHVYVTINEVKVHNVDTDSWEVINDFSATEYGELQVDLMALRFDEELLGQKMIPAGTYDQIRLHVAADETEEDGGFNGAAQYSGKTYVVYDKDGDGQFEEDGIFIPSGTASGLKINHTFIVENGAVTRLVLDNDVSELLNAAGKSGLIILEPTCIEVIDKVVTGDVKGRVLVDVNGDGSIEDGEVISTENETIEDDNYTVIVSAYQNGSLVKETSVTNRETESASGEIIPAGSYYIRGLETGQYALQAKVVYTDGEQAGEVEPLFELREEKIVTIIAGVTVNANDLYLDKNDVAG